MYVTMLCEWGSEENFWELFFPSTMWAQNAKHPYQMSQPLLVALRVFFCWVHALGKYSTTELHSSTLKNVEINS